MLQKLAIKCNFKKMQSALIKSYQYMWMLFNLLASETKTFIENSCSLMKHGIPILMYSNVLLKPYRNLDYFNHG